MATEILINKPTLIDLLQALLRSEISKQSVNWGAVSGHYDKKISHSDSKWKREISFLTSWVN